jgi:hypothetical protein
MNHYLTSPEQLRHMLMDYTMVLRKIFWNVIKFILKSQEIHWITFANKPSRFDSEIHNSHQSHESHTVTNHSINCTNFYKTSQENSFLHAKFKDTPNTENSSLFLMAHWNKKPMITHYNKDKDKNSCLKSPVCVYFHTMNSLDFLLPSRIILCIVQIIHPTKLLHIIKEEMTKFPWKIKFQMQNSSLPTYMMLYSPNSPIGSYKASSLLLWRYFK